MADGSTALHAAVGGDHAVMVELLLQNGALDVHHGHTDTLESARARHRCLLRPRSAALGDPALPRGEENGPCGPPLTASCLRQLPPKLPTPLPTPLPLTAPGADASARDAEGVTALCAAVLRGGVPPTGLLLRASVEDAERALQAAKGVRPTSDVVA